MKINGKYIDEYKRIIQTTDLQKGYQEFIGFFRYLRIYLEQDMPEYEFTNSIVENNMDYSYFQFTNGKLKAKGLKYVISFVHLTFDYEIWLSGMNRKVQKELHNRLKDQQQKYRLTDNPNRTDFVLKNRIIDSCDYNDLDFLLSEMKTNIVDFIKHTKKLYAE